MAVREILTVPDPRLKQKALPVEAVDDATRALLDDMLETMYAAAGVGLAATQIGVAQRIVVMDLDQRESEDGGEKTRKPRFFVNPEVVWASEETAPYEEGCLSVPEYYDQVERPARIRVRYLDYDGKAIEEEAEGLYAVCFQHELDHLNGVLFIDHLSRLKREQAVKKVKKLKAA